MEEDLTRLLVKTPVPDELDAQRRAWSVVRAAYSQREPVRRPLRRLRPLVAVAVAVALVAAALSAPGEAFRDWIGDRFADDEQPRPALSRLPARGALLVVSGQGPWIVKRDGSKRLLGRYDDAGWSPAGRFVVVTRGQRITAVEPDGDPRWSLTRTQRLRHPRWAPGGLRVAYLAGRTLRVVDGNGTDDAELAPRVARAAPAWQPRADQNVLAYADRRGRVRVVDADSGRRLWRTSRGPRVRALAWSPSGALLVVRAGRGHELYDRTGRFARRLRGRLGDVAFSPSGRNLAYTTRRGGRTVVQIVGPRLRPRTVFSGAGRMGDVEWSPDGRWLLVGWPDANQWLFLRLPGVRRIITVEDVRREFDPGGEGAGPFPRLAGWCCTRQ